MAYRRDLDREERRRLQEYEDLVDRDYDPFHEKCGERVNFSDNKLIATTKAMLFTYGVAFSARPIPLGGIFQVKLLEMGVDWAAPLVSAQSIICPIHCTYSKVGGVISDSQ